MTFPGPVLPRRWTPAFLLLAACGGGDPDAARAADAAEASLQDPCALLDQTLLATRFDLTDAEVTWRPSRYSPQPLCTASWPKPDAAEIERRMVEEMADRMAARLRGEETGPLTLRTTNEVSLTINTPRAETPEEAAAGFESVVRILAEGVTAEVEGREVSGFRYDSEPVADLADRAIWVEGLSQVSVLSGRTIFHVTVQVDGDPAIDREHALALARALATRLN